MDFVKLTLSPYKTYHYQGSSNAKMLILGGFFITDVGCTLGGYPTYQDWTLDDSLGTGMYSNCTYLKKSNGFVILSDAYSELKRPTQVKITRKQFVQLLDDWQEKVCKRKPKEVTITYDGNQFTIETSDV
jgi:hypothetical protein